MKIKCLNEKYVTLMLRGMAMLKRLRDIREDRDLKQKNIAFVLGISIQQYQLYECGKREIPVHHLRTLCEYYHVSADYILELTDEPFPLKM